MICDWQIRNLVFVDDLVQGVVSLEGEHPNEEKKEKNMVHVGHLMQMQVCD
jgi:hypothetical protein